MAIFLVRHAKAGNREKWEGPDRLRPLSRAGREQAEVIARRLGEHAVPRILSSPYLRCVQTVEPLATKVGVAIEQTELLAEGEPFLPVIELLGDLPEHSVLCTHGDILPETIAALERREMVVHGPADFRKGAIWEIDRVNGVFVRARALRLD